MQKLENSTDFEKLAVKLAASKLNAHLRIGVVNPEQKFADHASLIHDTIVGLSAHATGVNFNPCLISVRARGFQASVTGFNFVPSLVEIQPNLHLTQMMGINIQPSLALIAPSGAYSRACPLPMPCSYPAAVKCLYGEVLVRWLHTVGRCFDLRQCSSGSTVLCPCDCAGPAVLSQTVRTLPGRTLVT